MRTFTLGFMLLTSFAVDAQQLYTPRSDDQVLAEVQRTRNAKPRLRDMQATLVKTPADLPAALAFAREAIMLGNEEGDPRDFGHAESALKPWWNLPKPPPDVLLLRATILQWRHDFGAATRDLATLITADNEDVDQAHLTRAVIELVQGDPVAARSDCAALIGHADTVTTATCIASANSLMARAPAMQKTLAEVLAQYPNVPPSARLWGYTEVAEIAVRLRHLDVAENAYRSALAVMGDSAHRDPYLLASYADFLLDQRRPAEVLKLLDGLDRIDNLLLRLALAEAQLAAAGDATAAAARDVAMDEIQKRFDETRQRGDFVHQREEARYLLELRHQTDHALDVAKQNWTVQREPADAILLLQAALATKQPDAAKPVLDWMETTGIEDQRLQALATQLAAIRQ